jgi:hypothetical protein
LAESQAHGIRSCVLGELYTGMLLEPVPVREGKTELYQSRISSLPPLVTASDSLLDLPLLRMTQRDGLTIWAGADASMADALTTRYELPQELVALHAASASSDGYSYIDSTCGRPGMLPQTLPMTPAMGGR